MVRLYTVLSALASVCLLGNLWLGSSAGGSPLALGIHVLFGLFTIVFVCFLHGLLMSWLLGLGKSQKTAVLEHGLDAALLNDMKGIKRRGFPMATFAPMLLILAGILGGGVRAGSVPEWLHLGAVLIAVAANLGAFPGQVRVLRENERLMAAVEAAVAARAAVLTPATQGDGASGTST